MISKLSDIQKQLYYTVKKNKKNNHLLIIHTKIEFLKFPKIKLSFNTIIIMKFLNMGIMSIKMIINIVNENIIVTTKIRNNFCYPLKW